MKHRKITFVEVSIVLALVVIILSLAFGLRGTTPTGLEAERKAKIVNTGSALYLRIDNESQSQEYHPKVFFKTAAGQLYNIHHMLRINETWMNSDYGTVQLTEVEKVRFEEWIDSWGVLTQEIK